MALTSPWAVGSLRRGDRVHALADDLAVAHDDRGKRAASAGSTFWMASAMARRRNSGLGGADGVNLLTTSLSGESNHSMSQAFRSTRVLTAEGLAPATLLVEGERIAEVRELGRCAGRRNAARLLAMRCCCRAWWTRTCTSTSPAARSGKAFGQPRGGSFGRRDHAGGYAAELRAGDYGSRGAWSQAGAAQGKAWVDWAAWGGVVRGNSESLPALAARAFPDSSAF
jgi:hypothetical protein